MNLLVDTPPKTVMIGGAEYEIRSDFRASILYELLWQDDDVPHDVKIRQSLDIYFPVVPEADIYEIFDAISWFYLCGRTEKERKLQDALDRYDDDDEVISTSSRVYSFDYDDEYIFAAFQQQYGINLSEVEYLHWWQFRAMFKALNDSCQFVKIMGYRATKISSDMSKTEKEFLRKMKSIHALPVSAAEQRENDALADALMNGKDLSGLLE